MEIPATIDRIVIPKIGTWQAVQLVVDNIPFLRCRPKTHNAVLEEILKELGMQYKPVEMQGLEVPPLKGDRYEVVGMCYCTRQGNVLIFTGRSSLYKIGVNHAYIETIKRELPDFVLKAP